MEALPAETVRQYIHPLVMALAEPRMAAHIFKQIPPGEHTRNVVWELLRLRHFPPREAPLPGLVPESREDLKVETVRLITRRTACVEPQAVKLMLQARQLILRMYNVRRVLHQTQLFQRKIVR